MNQELFGEDRLLEHLQDFPGRTARETTMSVLEAVRRHATGAKQSDDITVLSVHYSGTGSGGCQLPTQLRKTGLDSHSRAKRGTTTGIARAPFGNSGYLHDINFGVSLAFHPRRRRLRGVVDDHRQGSSRRRSRRHKSHRDASRNHECVPFVHDIRAVSGLEALLPIDNEETFDAGMMMKPRRQSGRNVRGHGEHRVLLRRWQRGQRRRRHVLTTVVVRRCGLNRHEPCDAVRRESNAGRTDRSLCGGLRCESIDVPDRWRLETQEEAACSQQGCNRSLLDVQVSFRRSSAPIAPTPSALNR